ncbi:MAG: hypothetical protein ABJQ39_09140 [Winogradskyella arenosi]
MMITLSKLIILIAISITDHSLKAVSTVAEEPLKHYQNISINNDKQMYHFENIL